MFQNSPIWSHLQTTSLMTAEQISLSLFRQTGLRREPEEHLRRQRGWNGPHLVQGRLVPGAGLVHLVNGLFNSFFLKWPTPTYFSFIFGLFQTNNTNQCEKMSKCPSSIRRWDSNLQPDKHELSPITTRTGLLPSKTRDPPNACSAVWKSKNFQQ